MSNVEKVLLETADGVSEVKRKLEFGIQQIVFKVSFEAAEGASFPGF